MSQPPPSAVVIAGGGPVGLGLALELALHGVRSLVIEQRQSGQWHRARTNYTNIRSMEHFRRWGVADQLRRNDPVGDRFTRNVTWVTGLDGHVVVDFPATSAFTGPIPIASELPVQAPNFAIEKTLETGVEANPLIEVVWGSEVRGFTQDDDGVTVTYADADGLEVDVRCSYLVGSDGSRSVIRHQLGVRMQGQNDLAEAGFWLIHAPGLTERTTVSQSTMRFFINEHRDAAMLIVQDDDDHFMFGVLPATEGVDPDDWESAREILYRNVGFEFPVEPIHGGRTRVHSMIVPRFDHGRVFLAGDAAHLISPMGGFGMNIGIGDSADLGWKLAAVLNGWGGPRLLESYGIERSTAITWIQQECIDNTTKLAPQFAEDGISADGPDGDTLRKRIATTIFEEKAKEFGSIGAQLGYRYDGSPIVVDDGSTRPPLSMGEFIPCAAPGARAPHLWLADGSSLFDHLGPGFTLLKAKPDADGSALEAAAASAGLPLTVIAPSEEGLAELFGARLVLVRPDQHVAWRGDAVPNDPAAVIDTVRGA